MYSLSQPQKTHKCQKCHHVFACFFLAITRTESAQRAACNWNPKCGYDRVSGTD